MKKDMPKILAERQRLGVWCPNEQIRTLRHTKPTEDDLAPMRISMRPKRVSHTIGENGMCRTPNENLTPLRHFLQSKVGSMWDDVFREIRRANPFGNAVTEHIYVHLYDYV